MRAVVPGDTEKSESIYRVETDDVDELMPPPKSKRVLTAREKKLLREWVEQGAEFDEHWAFVAPESSVGAGRGDAIDHFVRARLVAEKLSPSGEADRRTLIRRASLDLTGLPPAPGRMPRFTSGSPSLALGTAIR